FQRTLAANLSRLLPTEQIYLSAWKRDQVKLRVSITVEQFDVDTQGRGRLTAWWRISPPSTDKPLKSGKASLVQTGASPQGNPQALVATLSELTTQFSRMLAEAIRECALAGQSTSEGGGS
ncbi:MAG TPA: ABC-type transport auxiliary lipoprotein family protein, partial [Candidatus Sulfotelmatobacter sp.]|nr:ABC-type transport auxiliary lipoprotein family protein [Candidatus Sulfotelmatobacter sp.]